MDEKLELIIFYADHMESFSLDRSRTFGRTSRTTRPDIKVNQKYVSRQHGVFYVEGGIVRYTNISETNGTFYNGIFMHPGEACNVSEGDIFIVRPKVNPEISGMIMIVQRAGTAGKEWRFLDLSQWPEGNPPGFLFVITTYFPDVIRESLCASLERNPGSPSGWTIIQKDPEKAVSVNHIQCTSYDLNVNDVVSVMDYSSVVIESGKTLWYQVDKGAQGFDQLLSNPEFGKGYFHLRLDAEDTKKGPKHPGRLKLRCKRCGSEVFEGERFCIECGAPSGEFEIVK